MKKIIRAFTTVLVSVVIILAILLVGLRLVGLQIFTVLSGSMEPNYHTGSLIYVKEVDPAELQVRDVITFMLSEDTTATHRIIELVPDDEDPSLVRFRTQGDANDVPDSTLVHPDNVIGTPVFSIPYLGYAANYIQSPPGMYIAIAVGAGLVLLVVLMDLIADDDSDKKDKKSKKKGKTEENSDDPGDESSVAATPAPDNAPAPDETNERAE